MIISEALWYKLSRFHQLAGKIEWSGPIFYTIEGNLMHPDDMVITVDTFMLKDIGSGAYTEYEFDGDVIDLYEDRPELIAMRIGHLHTHHSMRVFFSGTDMQCLHDNASGSDMFLSIIVNTEGHRIAKIAFIAKVQQTLTYKFMKELFSFNIKPLDYLAIMDCKLVIENDTATVEEFNKIQTIKEEKQKKARKNYSQHPINTQTGRRVIGGEPNVQFEMFKGHANGEEDEFEIIASENEHLLNDEPLKNLLARSFTIDDNQSGELSAVIAEVWSKLPQGDHSLEVSIMLEHFKERMEDDYYPDQYEYVLSRCNILLDEYTSKYRYINSFRRHIDDQLNLLSRSNGGNIDSTEVFSEENFKRSANKDLYEF